MIDYCEKLEIIYSYPFTKKITSNIILGSASLTPPLPLVGLSVYISCLYPPLSVGQTVPAGTIQGGVLFHLVAKTHPACDVIIIQGIFPHRSRANCQM